jgi:hypothetical protein
VANPRSAAADAGPVIADLDVWIRAFGRLEADPRVVLGFTALVRARRLLLLGWQRQALLARFDDDRQAERMAWILAGFPEAVAIPADRVAAAALSRRHRHAGSALGDRAALTWAVAARIGARIWSLDQRWRTWDDVPLLE